MLTDNCSYVLLILARVIAYQYCATLVISPPGLTLLPAPNVGDGCFALATNAPAFPGLITAGKQRIVGIRYALHTLGGMEQGLQKVRTPPSSLIEMPS